MIFYAVGVNHKTAPVALREEMHLSSEEIQTALQEKTRGLLKEACIISTCNRTELYGMPEREDINGQHLVQILRSLRPNAKLDDEHFFRTFTCGAVSHLFRVASALESQVLGDVQILGQVKDSYDIAIKSGSIGNVFSRMFNAAIHTGKRVRTATGIGIGAVSISHAAIELARKIFQSLERKRVLVIGTGETGSLAAKSMVDKGVGEMVLANRTLAKAEALANGLRARVIPFESISGHLIEMDLVVTATSSPDIIINADMVRTAMKHRQNRPLLILDIALPRDVDPEAGTLPNVFLKDLDALQGLIDQNIEKRQNEIPKAEQIVTEEVVNFFLWFNALDSIPTIQQLRGRFEHVRAAEFERFKNKLSADNLDTVEMLTRRIINKLLHPTMVSLKEPAFGNEKHSNKVELLRNLFDLNDKDTMTTGKDIQQ